HVFQNSLILAPPTRSIFPGKFPIATVKRRHIHHFVDPPTLPGVALHKIKAGVSSIVETRFKPIFLQHVPQVEMQRIFFLIQKTIKRYDNTINLRKAAINWCNKYEQQGVLYKDMGE